VLSIPDSLRIAVTLNSVTQQCYSITLVAIWSDFVLIELKGHSSDLDQLQMDSLITTFL